MKTINIGLIGLGTVGRSLLDVLQKDHELITRRTGIQIRIVRVCDRSWEKKKSLLASIPSSDNPSHILEDTSIDIIVELMGGIEIAREMIQKALIKGKSVVTANKAVLAHHGNELFALALEKSRELCFEAAVGGSIPLIQNLRRGLVANRIHSITGILNGTSNFILSQMGNGKLSYQEALSLAQSKGYAEADPSHDVEGKDAAQKLAILSALSFDIPIMQDSVQIRGIQNIDEIDLKIVDSLGYCIRPLSSAVQEEDGSIRLCVHPAIIPQDHLLFSIRDTMNAVIFDTNLSKRTALIGPGAGGNPTVSSVISDLVFIGKKSVSTGGNSTGGKPIVGQDIPEKYIPERWTSNASIPKIIKDRVCRFYLRFRAQDQPGVLAEVCRLLADEKISIATLSQQEYNIPVDVVILTHPVSEKKMESSIKKMNQLARITEPVTSIHIEDSL